MPDQSTLHPEVQSHILPVPHAEHVSNGDETDDKKGITSSSAAEKTSQEKMADFAGLFPRKVIYCFQICSVARTLLLDAKTTARSGLSTLLSYTST